MMSIADGFYQGVCDDEAMHLRSWLYADHDSGLDLLESSELGDNDPQQRTAPSKPGKTAQNHTRRFVVHQYRDRAQDVVATSSCTRRYEGATLFPIKLHKALGEVQEQGLDHIISWVSHGRCFKIHNTDAFVELVMPRYGFCR
jgi:HSF-type DNA-binding